MACCSGRLWCPSSTQCTIKEEVARSMRCLQLARCAALQCTLARCAALQCTLAVSGFSGAMPRLVMSTSSTLHRLCCAPAVHRTGCAVHQLCCAPALNRSSVQQLTMADAHMVCSRLSLSLSEASWPALRLKYLQRGQSMCPACQAMCLPVRPCSPGGSALHVAQLDPPRLH
jgi:hypothetical protein